MGGETGRHACAGASGTSVLPPSRALAARARDTTQGGARGAAPPPPQPSAGGEWSSNRGSLVYGTSANPLSRCGVSQGGLDAGVGATRLLPAHPTGPPEDRRPQNIADGNRSEVGMLHVWHLMTCFPLQLPFHLPTGNPPAQHAGGGWPSGTASVSGTPGPQMSAPFLSPRDQRWLIPGVGGQGTHKVSSEYFSADGRGGAPKPHNSCGHGNPT